MEYMNNVLLETAKSGNWKFFEKVPVSELTSQTIFNLIKHTKDKDQKTISKLILNKPNNAENECQALKLAFMQLNIPVAWLILNTWAPPKDKIDLSNCNLEQFPTFPGNVSIYIKEFDLSGNNIDILNISLQKYPNLNKVNLDGNPLSIYPERCRTSWPRMKEYLQSIENRAEARNIKKLLIVGEEGVGKSTLLKCLRKKANKTNVAENISTDGIDITDITLTSPSNDKPLIFKAWDFGGQEIYYPSHQFFLTSRSVYILCFNLASKDSVTRISYWVQQIQSMTKLSEKDKHSIDNVVSAAPPIFLVGTHLDDKLCINNSNYVEEKVQELEQLFKKFRYQGLFRIICVSCKSGRGISELKDALYQTTFESLKGRGNVSPSWILFLDYLQRTKETGVSYLEWSKYEQIASKFKLQGSVLLTCTNYLSDIGAILYYRLSLKDYASELVILEPQWLANLMMCFFTTQTTFIKNGMLSLSDVPLALRNYRPYLHQSLLALLSKFGVIYHMLNTGEYLIPNLLSDNIPSDVPIHWPLSAPCDYIEQGREYHFSFLPLGFFSRIAVRLLNIRLIECYSLWRTGVILAIPSSRQKAKIIFNETTNTLSVLVRIPNYMETDDETPSSSPTSSFSETSTDDNDNTIFIMLLRLIVEEVETLIECFYPRLLTTTQRYIPCTHCLLKQYSTPYLFKFEDIMDSMSTGVPFLFCHNIKSPSRIVKLEELAPDICFVDLPKIDPVDLNIISEIGEGSFGKIYKGLLKGIDVAIKSVKASVQGIDRTKFYEFQQESFLMSNLEHPNIVNLFGVTLKPLQMVMELVTCGDLYELMHPPDPNDPSKRTRLPPDESRYSWKFRLKIALDIAKGMQYLQNINPPIIHRDLRSPNIFLVSLSEDAEIIAKVADFGLSRTLSSNVAGSLSSWQWLAPEVIREDSSEYGLKSDVYSFGTVLWELITFLHPFDEFIGVNKFTRILNDGTGAVFKVLNPTEVKHAIIFENLRPTIPPSTPETIQAIVKQCWLSDPDRRPSFDEIVFILSSELGLIGPILRKNVLKASSAFKRRASACVSRTFEKNFNFLLNMDDFDENTLLPKSNNIINNSNDLQSNSTTNITSNDDLSINEEDTKDTEIPTTNIENMEDENDNKELQNEQNITLNNGENKETVIDNNDVNDNNDNNSNNEEVLTKDHDDNEQTNKEIEFNKKENIENEVNNENNNKLENEENNNNDNNNIDDTLEQPTQVVNDSNRISIEKRDSYDWKNDRLAELMGYDSDPGQPKHVEDKIEDKTNEDDTSTPRVRQEDVDDLLNMMDDPIYDSNNNTDNDENNISQEDNSEIVKDSDNNNNNNNIVDNNIVIDKVKVEEEKKDVKVKEEIFTNIISHYRSFSLEKHLTHLLYQPPHFIWAAGVDGSISTFSIEDIENINEELVLPAPNNQKITCFTSLGKSIIICYADGNVGVLSSETRSMKCFQLLKTDGKAFKTILKVYKRLDPNPNSIPQITIWGLPVRDKQIYIWDACSFELIKVVQVAAVPMSIEKCGENVWVGMENGEIHSFDIFALEAIGSWKAHNTSITNIYSFANYVWSSSDTGEICFWDILEGNISLMSTKKVHMSNISKITLFGNYICTSSYDQSLLVWNPINNEAMQEAIESQSSIIAMVQVKQHLFIISNDGYFRIYNYSLPFPNEPFFSKQFEDKFDFLLDDDSNLEVIFKNRNKTRRSLMKTVAVGFRKRSDTSKDGIVAQSASTDDFQELVSVQNSNGEREDPPSPRSALSLSAPLNTNILTAGHSASTPSLSVDSHSTKRTLSAKNAEPLEKEDKHTKRKSGSHDSKLKKLTNTLENPKKHSPSTSNEPPQENAKIKKKSKFRFFGSKKGGKDDKDFLYY